MRRLLVVLLLSVTACHKKAPEPEVTLPGRWSLTRVTQVDFMNGAAGAIIYDQPQPAGGNVLTVTDNEWTSTNQGTYSITYTYIRRGDTLIMTSVTPTLHTRKHLIINLQRHSLQLREVTPPIFAPVFTDRYYSR